MNQPSTIRRLATGVPGLDAILGGGLPEYSPNFFSGPPGSDKTTLACQIMSALATPECPAHCGGQRMAMGVSEPGAMVGGVRPQHAPDRPHGTEDRKAVPL